MTHYQKLAILVFRIIGLILILTSFILWTLAFIANLSKVNPFFTLFSILPYLIVGIILFALSKFLAKWICFDFEKFDEQK
jgi:hypothetical protein